MQWSLYDVLFCISQLRNQYGSQDTITTVDDREVRHCNWVRFLKYSTSLEEVNIVGIKLKGEVIFQTVKKILPNDEIVAYLEDTTCESLTQRQALIEVIAAETITGKTYTCGGLLRIPKGIKKPSIPKPPPAPVFFK